MSSSTIIIDKLALVTLRAGKLLVARSFGKEKFYIPGGKRETGESDIVALGREIKEEISTDLVSGSISLFGVFEAPAHGKPEGTTVKVTAYNAEYDGVLAPNNEIEELHWVGYGEKESCSHVTQLIMDDLHEKGLLATPTPPVSLDLYDWIIFDADETLFHFKSKAGLTLMFSKLGIDFTDEDFKEYSVRNKALWEAYEKHEVTAVELAEKRFEKWVIEGRTGADLNVLFLNAMAEVCVPLIGAVDVVKSLAASGKNIAIISNGFTQLQMVRLKKYDMDLMEFVLTSEDAGIAKPHEEIFNQALVKMGNPDPARVLMVGDNPKSDILGAQRVGIHTCWLNIYNKPLPDGVEPATHDVVSMRHLLEHFGLSPFFLEAPKPPLGAHVWRATSTEEKVGGTLDATLDA